MLWRGSLVVGVMVFSVSASAGTEGLPIGHICVFFL